MRAQALHCQESLHDSIRTMPHAARSMLSIHLDAADSAEDVFISAAAPTPVHAAPAAAMLRLLLQPRRVCMLGAPWSTAAAGPPRLLLLHACPV